MTGGAAVRRSSASPSAENTVAWSSKAAPRAGQRLSLADVTNLVVRDGGRPGAAYSTPDAKLSSTKSLAHTKKGGFSASLHNVNTARGSDRKTISSQFDMPVPQRYISFQGENVFLCSMPCIAPAGGNSPGLSEDSISMEDAMSTCSSVGIPDVECADDGGSSVASSLHCLAADKLRITNPKNVAVENIIDIDKNWDDPQWCASLADDIYKNLRQAETRGRPSTNFMDTTQIDMSTSMRALLIDWLVEVIEEYRLVPETLYLTVNYIDRYLSVKVISRHRLQLLGIACLLIAAKYEEICPPQVEELCYLTDDSYTKDEVLQMEASVLNYLDFEMAAPTAKCFLRRFVYAAQVCDEGSTLHLEFTADYICELSLLEYSLLGYVPSLVAASSLFLAKFIHMPTKNPWNSTLSYYTQYTPSELCGCVRALHRLFCFGPGSNLPAVREKYSQHKYKFVAKKYCPPSIPSEFFHDVISRSPN